MKQLTVLALASIFTFGATSCKKERICSCVDSSKTITMLTEKKSVQKKRCDDWAAANQTSCTLK
jgi:hypothetical protein